MSAMMTADPNLDLNLNGTRVLITGVLGGMITATVLAVFWVPVFFVIVIRVFTRSEAAPAPTEGSALEKTG